MPSFSTRTFFVVTSPDALHAGVPASLAVTVLADFPGKLVAEVANGDTSVVQTGEFQGGDAADMLTLMRFIVFFFSILKTLNTVFPTLSRFHWGRYSPSGEFSVPPLSLPHFGAA